MATSKILLLCLLSFSLTFTSCFGQSCGNFTFKNTKTYASCNDLPFLNSYIHWTYDRETSTVDMAYRHVGIDSSQWVAWALNPNGRGMIGSQALVAYVDSHGHVHAYTSSISSYGTRLESGPLSFDVPKISAEFSNNEAIIYATLALPKNMTTVNQVWQDGPLNGDALGMHKVTGDNVRAMGTIDFLSGQVVVPKGGVGTSSKARMKNFHGVMNAVTWGILMPVGAMIARYMKIFKSADPLWFYLHIGCQLTAYLGGIGGAATGFYLGNKSKGIQFDTHRNVGISLLCLGVLQILALFLRPKKDNKYRKYWNLYHHSIGYVVIVLSIFNVYKGLSILDAGNLYKLGYSLVVIVLGLSCVILEGVRFYVKRRATASVDLVECNDVV